MYLHGTHAENFMAVIHINASLQCLSYCICKQDVYAKTYG